MPPNIHILLNIANNTHVFRGDAEAENGRLEQELRQVRGQLEWAKGGIAALHKVIDESLAKHMPVDKIYDK